MILSQKNNKKFERNKLWILKKTPRNNNIIIIIIITTIKNHKSLL